MKICYFGIYDPNYSRNRILNGGLRENGVEVIECRTELKGVKKYFDLVKKHWRIRKDYDAMVVGFPGYQAMILARFLTRKKIIFDAFTSLYDSLVLDRKTVNKNSLSAYYYWLLDWLSCGLADKILLDTNEQIDYFVDTFKIKKEKFIRIFVGSAIRLDDINKKKEERDYFLVNFYGTDIPLQGVEYIIEAAELLKNENIRFSIIGTKIKKRYESGGYANIDFFDNMEFKELIRYVASADINLGIFGGTEKARRVIPNKVYDALAVGSAIITGDTPAAREILSDGVNAVFCRMADAGDLAEKILLLKSDNNLRNKISRDSRDLFQNYLRPKLLACQLLNLINI